MRRQQNMTVKCNGDKAFLLFIVLLKCKLQLFKHNKRNLLNEF